MPITFNCRLCGKETTRPPSQVGGGYCSMKCSRIARLKPDPTGELKRERLRRYAAAYRNKALKAIETDTEHPSTCTITCNTCGKKIRRYKSDIKRTDKHYCSQKCVNADRIGPNNPQWNRKEKLCAVCGKTMLLAPSIWEKTKYCSRECKGLTQRKDKEQIKEKKRKRDNIWKKEFYKKHPEKWACQQMVKSALTLGMLTKPIKCEDCRISSKNLKGHHEDYTKPLKVNWLCQKCHGLRHAKTTPEEITEIIADYKTGMSMVKVAKKHGISDCWVSILLKRNNIELRKPGYYNRPSK